MPTTLLERLRAARAALEGGELAPAEEPPLLVAAGRRLAGSTEKINADLAGLVGDAAGRQAALARSREWQESAGTPTTLPGKIAAATVESLPMLALAAGPGRFAGLLGGVRAGAAGMGATYGVLGAPDIIDRGRQLGNTGLQQATDVAANMAVQTLVPMAFPGGTEAIASAALPGRGQVLRSLSHAVANAPAEAVKEGVEEVIQNYGDRARQRLITGDPEALPVLPVGPQAVDVLEADLIAGGAGMALGGPMELAAPSLGAVQAGGSAVADAIRARRADRTMGQLIASSTPMPGPAAALPLLNPAAMAQETAQAPQSLAGAVQELLADEAARQAVADAQIEAAAAEVPADADPAATIIPAGYTGPQLDLPPADIAALRLAGTPTPPTALAPTPVDESQEIPPALLGALARQEPGTVPTEEVEALAEALADLPTTRADLLGMGDAATAAPRQEVTREPEDAHPAVAAEPIPVPAPAPAGAVAPATAADAPERPAATAPVAPAFAVGQAVRFTKGKHRDVVSKVIGHVGARPVLRSTLGRQEIGRKHGVDPGILEAVAETPAPHQAEERDRRLPREQDPAVRNQQTIPEVDHVPAPVSPVRLPDQAEPVPPSTDAPPPTPAGEPVPAAQDQAPPPVEPPAPVADPQAEQVRSGRRWRRVVSTAEGGVGVDPLTGVVRLGPGAAHLRGASLRRAIRRAEGPHRDLRQRLAGVQIDTTADGRTVPRDAAGLADELGDDLAALRRMAACLST